MHTSSHDSHGPESRSLQALHTRTGGRQQGHRAHPELLLITPGGRTAVVVTGDDAVKIIHLLLVTAIDIDGDSSANADNSN